MDIVDPNILPTSFDSVMIGHFHRVDEIDIGKITIGQEVTLKVSAYRDKVIKHKEKWLKLDPKHHDFESFVVFQFFSIENEFNC